MMKIEAENLSWIANPATIIDGIDMPATPGCILGSLGPSGSGKSTLLGMLTRTIQPRMGVVRLDDRPYGDWASRDVVRVLSVVQQKATTDQDVTVRDAVDPGRISHRHRWAGSNPHDRKVVGVATRRTDTEYLLNCDRRALSGGEQQHAHLTRVFVQGGQVMLLDEPTNHLDISHQLDILKTLRETGLGVVVALYDPSLTTTFCDGVLVLRKGRVVCPRCPADVLTEDLIREVYEMEVRILHLNGDGAPLFQFLRPVTRT